MMATERRGFVDQEVVERGLEVIASMQRSCDKTDVDVKVVLKLS